MHDHGTFEEAADGTVALRYERSYPRPIATVWAALTQPERLVDWLGACDVEPRVGGTFNVFVDHEASRRIAGRVLTWQPPTLLSFSWRWPGEPETTVRCELAEAGPRETRLVFTHAGMVAPRVGSTLPGWHVFLERLGEVLDERTPGDLGERFKQIQGVYRERGGLPDGAVVSSCS